MVAHSIKLPHLSLLMHFLNPITETPVLKQQLSKRPKFGFEDQLSLNAGQKYCILQYLQPSFSYHLSLRSSFCLFLSGHLGQVLLYTHSGQNS